MKIIVTGAAGAIGSHLSERLIQDGHEVIGVDGLLPYYDPAIKKSTSELLETKGVKMHYANLLDENTQSIFLDAEAVFHLAAQPGISARTSFDDYLNNNIVATHKILETLKNNKNLEVFVNASTSSVYGKSAVGDENSVPMPASTYGVTKLAAEQLALSDYRISQLPVVNLRFFSVLGERERPEKFFFKLIKAMLEDKEIEMFEGSDKHIRSYTYVGDIVNGCIKVLEKKKQILGETFNLGNDQAHTTGEALNIVEELIGKKAKIKVMPKRTGDQLETRAIIDKARKILEYNPETNLKEALKKEIEWYMKFIHGKF